MFQGIHSSCDRQGRLEDAARGYEAVLAAEPNHVEALVHLGGTFGLATCGRRGRVWAELGGGVGSGFRRSACEPGVSTAGAGAGGGRRRRYRLALALDPSAAHVQFALAGCLQALGRRVDAIACYEALLAAEPAHPEANYGLATLFAELDRADEAIVRYRAALTADPDFAEASYGLGRC